MNPYKKTIVSVTLVMSILLHVKSYGQQSVNSSGTSATGTGGSISYTVGQIDYQSDAKGTLELGVQHGYLKIIQSINNLANIHLSVFPNPTASNVQLSIDDFNKKMSYQLFDPTGRLLMEHDISQNHTDISLANYAIGTYFLKINSEQGEISSFKIIKN